MVGVEARLKLQHSLELSNQLMTYLDHTIDVVQSIPMVVDSNFRGTIHFFRVKRQNYLINQPEIRKLRLDILKVQLISRPTCIHLPGRGKRIESWARPGTFHQ